MDIFIGVFVFVFSRITQKLLADFHKIRLRGGIMGHWKTLDFGGNPDHVTLGLGLWWVADLWLQLGGASHIPCHCNNLGDYDYTL